MSSASGLLGVSSHINGRNKLHRTSLRNAYSFILPDSGQIFPETKPVVLSFSAKQEIKVPQSPFHVVQRQTSTSTTSSPSSPEPSQPKRVGQPKREILDPAKKRKRDKANDDERKRMGEINKALLGLKEKRRNSVYELGSPPLHRQDMKHVKHRESKIKTLRWAIQYIKDLRAILDAYDDADASKSPPSLEYCDYRPLTIKLEDEQHQQNPDVREINNYSLPYDLTTNSSFYNKK